MANSNPSLKVFLSHAHADAEVVRNLYHFLIANGIDAWLDKEKLLPGQDWELEIRKAVRESDAVIVCLSRQFNLRGYRQKEVRIALEEAKMQPEGDVFIVPIRLEDCEIPESLRRYHSIDLYVVDGYEKLTRALWLRDQQLENERIKRDEITKNPLPPIEQPFTGNDITEGERGILMNKGRALNGDVTWNASSVKLEREDGERRPIRQPVKGKEPVSAQYIVAIIGAAATIFVGILNSPLLEKFLEPTPTTAVATVGDTPTPSQIATPTDPATPTLTATVTASPTPYFPCANAPQSKMKVGGVGRTTITSGQSTWLRSAPEAGDNIVSKLPEGIEFEVVGGPICYQRPGRPDSYVYWEVVVPSRNVAGWIAEGDFEQYYIRPWP